MGLGDFDYRQRCLVVGVPPDEFTRWEITVATNGLEQSQQKMRQAGVSEAAIEVFSYYYDQLEGGSTGMILEESIEPYLDPPKLEDLTVSDESAREAIQKTAIIKLNGGLGTSMGLDQAKTLLEVRDGKNFLDLIAQQVESVRAEYDAPLPLLFMTSFRTEEDTLAHLDDRRELLVDDLPLTFIQNQEPKLLAEDLTPVTWPADPTLEWCPPGHGDIYTALVGSGILDQLLEKGFRYVSISNGDNLGAYPSAKIAGWFAGTGAPYAAELCRRTVNDKKGGHLAVRKADGQLILRDTAQTLSEEMDFFTDEHRHPYFHTNNLWMDLEQLKERLGGDSAVLGMPLIRNEKTVDPTDPNSPAVIQIETAMGAAIEVFPGSTAICVGRDRFLPVKTTNELLLLRSDVYRLDGSGRLVSTVQESPEVDLTKSYYQTIQDFDKRIPEAPSLRSAKRLRVEGDWTFEPDVTVEGDVVLGPEGGTVTGVI